MSRIEGPDKPYRELFIYFRIRVAVEIVVYLRLLRGILQQFYTRQWHAYHFYSTKYLIVSILSYGRSVLGVLSPSTLAGRFLAITSTWLIPIGTLPGEQKRIPVGE